VERKDRGTAVVLVSGIAAGSLLVGVAAVGAPTDFTYATKQTGYTVIAPADMQPESYVTQYATSQGDRKERAATSEGSIFARVHASCRSPSMRPRA
jgi:hypothetical protein